MTPALYYCTISIAIANVVENSYLVHMHAIYATKFVWVMQKKKDWFHCYFRGLFISTTKFKLILSPGFYYHIFIQKILSAYNFNTPVTAL